MFAVLKRDFRSYFSSPIAYVLIGLFLSILSIYFMSSLSQGVANFSSGFVNTMSFILIFIVPILTMRIIAEDRKNGTEILLLTSPTRISEIVLGKYLAVFSVFLVMTATTLVFPLVLWIYGSPEGAALFSSYLGFILLGAVYVAIGVFASSLTENQIVAAIISLVSLFVLYALSFVASFIGGFIYTILTWLSVMERYYDFTNGIIDLTSIVFMLSFAIVFIFLTVRVIERKRWSQG